MKRGHLIAGLTLCLAIAGIAIAQTAPSPALAPEKAARLTFTAAQVENGKAEYSSRCIDCHGANLNDGEFGGPPLKGEAFREKWFDQPSSTLIGFTQAAMPPDAPGRLSLDAYVEIVAYILSNNGVAASDRPAPANMDALGALNIEADAVAR
ncbi:cytochrome c [Devosia sp.]|uniref:c-type cytochrome n=1 Tax=Devosia sp. TaxID=1871048 RepID=UPI002618CC96|nr:cytochrome c [Devosia sp.]